MYTPFSPTLSAAWQGQVETYCMGIFGMNEPTITCQHCKAQIRLTDSLAAPLIRATRAQYEEKIAEKEAEVARRESAIRAQRAELARAVESIEQQVTTRFKNERERIAAEEAKKARLLLARDLESKSQEIADVQREVQERDNKLAEAQKSQSELIRKQRELEDAKREMDLQIETRVQESLAHAEDALKKEERIASMQRQIEEMEMIYQYLTGPRFRQRIEAMVEKFSDMQTDFEREGKAMRRLRAKREEHVRGVVESTVGMYGDLKGIAGKTLEEIDGLVQIARRLQARRKRGLTPRRVTKPAPT